jgi:glycosyltransferase involved in cell wall biosynthesis
MLPIEVGFGDLDGQDADCMTDTISIIIPTRNRSAILSKCLAALPDGVRGLDLPEIIVVDDCSIDETREVVEAFGRSSGWPVQCLRQERPLGANAARNAALKVSGGQIIVLIDDDVIAPPGWLEQLLLGLSPECPVVSGAVRLTVEGPVLGKHREEVQALLGEILHSPKGFDGKTVPVLGNLATYRWVFERAGFDATVKPPVEEADWLRRAGVVAGFVPGAWVWHYKTPEDCQPGRVLPGVWRRGSEGGWWIRERLGIHLERRLLLAAESLKTALRGFAHASLQRCWGGVVVGVGELARALALVGLINRGDRVPESWR